MVYVVFLSLLIDLLAFTMILPLLPSLLDYYKKNDGPDGLYASVLRAIGHFQDVLGAPDKFNSVLFGGFLGSMFSFLQFVISPIAGGLSDVYGRKPVLLICLTGGAVSYFLWAISHNFSVFVLARVVGGLSKGNVSLSMAAITDVSTSATRAAGMALVGIAFSLGFIIGPMIGAGFTKWSQSQQNEWFVVPATFALALALLDIGFVCVYFKETLPTEKRAKSFIDGLNQALSYINVAALFNFTAVTNLSAKDTNELRMLGRVYFVYLFLYSGLEFTLSFLTHHVFHYSAMDQGYMFAFIGVIMAVLQGGWVRRIPPTKVKLAAVWGLLLIVPSFVFIGLSWSKSLFYIGLFLFAVSTSMVVPCLNTLASQFGAADQKGAVMGIFRSLGALARALGPIVASVGKVYFLLGVVKIIKINFCIEYFI
ncbi:hypothetical protein AAG570_003131 [Ranatra chinensis]|uniref:Major facilitator superfamily (MFS) profile domain-containing protein n=1 Tax=Ranatra chinensis TaxID=642074 RepID=A0ABD0Y5Y5_9HEMI